MVALTRIKNNQITDSTINAASKVQSATITGGLLANNLTYGSDLTVSGNLTVNGQTTTIDTNVTTIEDPVILLASTQTGSPTVDIGFIGERGTSDNIAFVWDESADEFVTAFTSTSETNSTITISSYSNFHTNDANVGGNIVINGTSTLTGNANINGNLTVAASKTLIFGDNVLANVGTPTLDNDAATKAYVDGAVSSSGFTVTDGVSNATIEGGDTIEFTGTASEISVTQSGNAAYAIFTFGLPDNVTVTGNLLANKIDSNTTVTSTGNVSGGNITTAGQVSATGNITGGNLITGGLASVTGNVTGGNINTGGLVSATGNVTGGNITTAGQVVATGNVSGGNLTTAGDVTTATVTASGNVSGGNLLTGGLASVTGNITGGNLITAGLASVTGNVTGGNINTAGQVVATGNVSGGNLVTAGVASVTGNITGGNLITGGLASVTGNVTGGNLVTVGLTNTGTLQVSGNAVVDGNLTVNGNLSYINIDDLRVQDPIIVLGTGPNGAPLTTNDGLDRGVYMEYYTTGLGNAFMGWDNSSGNMVIAHDVVFTANDVVGVNSYGTLQAGNLYIQSAVSVGNVTGGNLLTGGLASVTGNITGGNLITAGLVSAATVTATGNITGGNLLTGGLINATGNVTGGNITTAGLVNATGNLQTGANIVASGYASVTGNVTGGNVTTAGLISATGNVTGGNLTTAGDVTTATVTATGNVSGGNLLTGGLASVTGNITGGNLITAGLVSAATVTATANVTGGNLITGGLASVTGNITGGNLITAGLASVTGNITGGNINTAGQVVATGNVNGGNVVATALVTGANVSATSNVSGANVVGTTSVKGGNIVISGDDITDVGGGIVTINSAGADVDFAVSGDTVANVFYVDAGTGTVSFGSATQTTNAIAAFNTTNSILLPVGNTGTRPGSGVTGMVRFNTTNNNLEVYDNSQWSAVGVPSFTVITNDSFAGDGTTVAFTLSESASTDSCIVSINGVVQIPTTAYSVSGTTLTFTEAPLTGDAIDVRILTTTTTVTSISNASGNAVIETLDTAATVQVTGDLLPGANNSQSLGSSTKRWSNLWVSGSTITLGNVVMKNVAGGNTIGFYGPDGTTPATIAASSVDTTQIQSGTSSMAVVSSGGNIRANIAGSTIQTISATGVEITGDLSVTGNATLSGNILGDRVQNGTTSFDIQSTNGNANITVAGTSNVAVFTTAGANITGTLGVTGNITGGNLSGTSIVGTLTTAAQTNITSVGTLSSLTVTGNVSGGNVTTTGVFAGSGAQLTNIPAANVTGTLSVNTTGYAATVSTAAQPNITSVGTLSSLSVTANVTAGNLSVGTGTITGGNIVNSNANGVGNIGSSTTYFNTVFAKATSAQYADLAEKYVADAEYPAGTVVVFGGDKEVTVSSTDADRAVAGVVSTNPSYIMNGGLEAEFVATVALTGRVPCRVTGTVRKGDLMVSAGYGLARAEQDPRVGTVIGKALENFEGNEGVIEVVVGRF